MADTVSGNLIPREYSNFRGVDLRGGEVTLYRSPDSLNMWKDYRKDEGISTRPEIELHETYDNNVYGIFFYKVGNTEMELIHCGTTLFRVVDGVRTELYTGLNPKKSNAFIYNNIFYFKDGINYLQYNGETIGEVVGYAPTTSIGRKPSGGGTIYEDVNMLSAYRTNTFIADGTSKDYYLDAQNIDTDFRPIVTVNGVDVTNFEVDTTGGIIKFAEAPTEPLTDGQDNVSIKFKRTVAGYRDRINKCTLLQVFDNRVFFSGNQDYPNTVWHCSLNDPSYCSDLDYYNEGLDLSPVRGMVAGNNALWVFKEPSQANTTVFYHNPVVDATYGKIYPSVHSSISTGCIGGAINFNDDIAFFSDRGMEAINGDVTTEQVVAHRSSFVDNKLLSEANYKNMIQEEWEGYLLVIIDNKVYLADSRKMATFENHNEYEWWYWELSKNITCTKVHNGILYLGTNEGIYKFGYEEDDYTEVTFTEENGQYVLYGESTQDGEPTPDAPVEIVNTYKAGIKYKTTINGREYRFILDDDLRSTPSVADRMWLDTTTGLFYVERKVGNIILNGKETNWFLNEETNTFWFFNNTINCLIGKHPKFSNYFTYSEETFFDASVPSLCENTTFNMIMFKVDTTLANTINKFMNWLSTHNVEVYYELAEYIKTNIDYMASSLSYYTTPFDNFKYSQYQKTTNKRGCVVDMTGENVTISVKTDNNEFEKIDTYTNTKGYIVSRIKRKKWREIQLKFSSNKPFSLYSATLESYVGGYIKR